jgi:hypothetical protein
MIAVQVELWPLGSGEDRKIIAGMVIENRGLDESRLSYRYAAELHHTGDPVLQISAGEQSVEIVGHDRRDTIWKLIHRVLSEALAEDGSQEIADRPIDKRAGGQDDGAR